MAISSMIEISYYKNEIPSFAEAEMEYMYGSLYSTPAYFRAYGGAENADTYVARKDGSIKAIFMFRVEGSLVRVLNEGMRSAPDELERFINFVFATYPDVTAIVFNAVSPMLRHFWRPYQCVVCTDDIVITLDASTDRYLSRLGNATRKNIRRHRNKLERMYPSFRFRAHAGATVDERIVRDIVALNQRRMTVKGKVSSLDEAETQRIVRLVRERGIVTAATIDDQVVAGAIVVRIGDCFCSLVNAHDPQYDAHRLGTICCFLTICESIERGGNRFDLMWGHYDYKTALLGEHRYLYRMIIYRSRVHQVLHVPLIVRTAISGLVCVFKMRMLQIANQQGKANATLLVTALSALRNVKKSLALGKDKTSKESLSVVE
jgi:hypothetical protein